SGAASTTCSKLSSTRNSCLLRRKLWRVSVSAIPGTSLTPSACAIVAATGPGSLIGTRLTKWTPSRNVSPSSDATDQGVSHSAICAAYLRATVIAALRGRFFVALRSHVSDKRRRRGHKTQDDVDFDVGAYQTALLVHNVLGWHGPAFVGVAC